MKKDSLFFLAPVIALVFSSFIYLLFMSSFHHFDPEGNRFFNILQLYPQLKDGRVLFLGESQVREDVDCELLEEKSGSKNWCYNFGLAGMLPIQLALQKDVIVAAKPKVVVFGITASTFDEGINKNDDFFFLLNGQQSVAAQVGVISQLTADEKKLLLMNFYEKALYKRKFILPFYFAVLDRLGSSSGFAQINGVSTAVSNVKNPHQFMVSENEDELRKRIEDPAIVKMFYFEQTPLREREAFTYLVGELKKEGVDVVIVQMPLHPLVRSVVTNESKKVFEDYLSHLSLEFGVKVINLENEFDDPVFFVDLTHLTKEGSTLFSSVLFGSPSFNSQLLLEGKDVIQ